MIRKRIRRYLLAGLFVWLPIIATFVVISFLIDLMDGSLALLPHKYHPDQLLGFTLPGMGLVLSVGVVFLTGLIVSNVIGKRLVEWGEEILSRIPLVRSVYYAVKQVLHTIFSSGSRSFRHVMLIEYPRKGLWSIAFETGELTDFIEDKLPESDFLTVFVPTTPNPTSGFLMIVPRAEVISLDISVDAALKLIISLGVVQPEKLMQESLLGK